MDVSDIKGFPYWDWMYGNMLTISITRTAARVYRKLVESCLTGILFKSVLKACKIFNARKSVYIHKPGFTRRFFYSIDINLVCFDQVPRLII